MTRKKFCGVVTPHKAHTWSDQDLDENPHSACPGIRPPAVNDPVYFKGSKYRVELIHHGVAELRRHRGGLQATVQLTELEYDRIPGLWRLVKTHNRS